MLYQTNFILSLYDKGEFSTEKPWNDTLYPKQEIIDFVRSPVWEQQIIDINKEITQGKGNILNNNNLKSSAVTIVNPLNYADFFADHDEVISINHVSMLGFYQMEAIFQYHPFTDGNKRTGVNAGIKLIEHIVGDNNISYLENDDQDMLARSIIYYFESGKSYPAQNKLKYVWNTIINFYLL